MKLIECHIENFGNLANCDFKFNSGITEFCEENGYGKTTLAAFIKAMFYGLPPVRTTTRDFNDRKHFYPFSGGKFGGSLTFETGGKIYRIERFFGKKSDTDDEVKVFCNNKPCADFGGDIGRAVFGVDKQSFERTAFVTSDAIDICATSGISAKLNNFAESSEDGAFDNAIAAMEKAKKELKAGRGNNDLISRTRQEIIGLTNSIKNVEDTSRALEKYYADEAKLKREIASAEAEIEKIKGENLLIERWERYEELLSDKKSYESALREIEQRYPSGIPSRDEVSEMKEIYQRIISLDGAVNAAVFGEEKQRRLNQLSQTFSGGVPDADFLQGLQTDVDEIKTLEAELKTFENRESTRRVADLERRFGGAVPSQSDIEKAEENIEKYLNLDNRLKARTGVAAAANGGGKKSNLKFILIAVLAAAVALGGVGVLFMNAVIGGVLLGLGVTGLGVDGFFYLKSRGGNGAAVVVDEGAVEVQAELQRTESAVRQFLAPYGYYSRNGVVFDFGTFKNDYLDFLQYAEEASERNAEAERRKARLNGLTEKVGAALAKYNVEERDMQKGCLVLQSAVNELKNLQADRGACEQRKHGAKRDTESCFARIEEILKKYSLVKDENFPAQLDGLLSDGAETARLAREIVKTQSDADGYAKRYNLTRKPASEKADAVGLAESVKQKRNDLAVIDGQISSAEAEVENLDDMRGRLEIAEKKLERYIQKHKNLSAAINFLTVAEQNLKDRYVAPIKKNFVYYADMIESALGEKISVDRDFNVTFERCGENRSDRHLSAGQRSVCALCFRLALINNMYGEEKPFIIMDDPFVHLDGNHLEKTAKTLKALAKDNQIIYFSCHQSRKIGDLN